MPRCLIVQHVDPEGPWAIAEAMDQAGVQVEVERVWADPLPDSLEGFDGLVVMGGPMSAASEDGFPSLYRELDLLRQAVDLGVPVLGVCLGAQILARAVGGQVFPGPAGPEIGWGQVELAPEAEDDRLLGGVDSSLTVLHWHGDTFELPPGAVLLASNHAYRNQAFRVGPAAWGLQFHLEVGTDAVESFTTAFADEAIQAGADPAAIRSAADGALSRLGPVRDLVLSRFASVVFSQAELGAPAQ